MHKQKRINWKERKFNFCRKNNHFRKKYWKEKLSRDITNKMSYYKYNSSKMRFQNF